MYDIAKYLADSWRGVPLRPKVIREHPKEDA